MINKIIIIESIPDVEKQTGKELYDDVIVKNIKYFNPEIEHFYHNVNTKNEFLEQINNLKQNLLEEDELVLHIEAHGGSEKLYFKNDESLKWTEFELLLADLNKICKNKLHLNLATCLGMHVAEKISLKNSAPYHTFISSLFELSPHEILHDNSILYEELIKSRNIFRGFVDFLIRNPSTLLKIKDVKTVLEFVLNRQIMMFIIASPTFDLKSFFDVYLNVNIDSKELMKRSGSKEKVEYILTLFFERYIP